MAEFFVDDFVDDDFDVDDDFAADNDSTVIDDTIIDDDAYFSVNHDSRDGYMIISRMTGIEYELLELKCYGGNATSDLVAIMVGLPDEGYVGQLDLLFGAEYVQDMLNDCKEIIKEFEEGKSKLAIDLSYDSSFADYVRQHNLPIQL